METITVKRDDQRDVKFTGELVGVAASSADRASQNYSGSTGRWAKLALYRTKGGTYVCERIEYTRWQGEQTGHSGAVCENEEQVVEFFGCGWLAKDLYEDASIDSAVEVE